MASTRLIIELNRCFKPNAFNSGPDIPTSAFQSTPDAIYAPSPQLPTFSAQLDIIPPDLSASPASSISSSSRSLTLEDEEIKRIFSHPKYDSYSDHQSYQQTLYYALSQQPRTFSPRPKSKEELNPYAQPFVPSFTHPLNSDFANVDVPRDFSSIPMTESPQPQAPMYPPGLPHPAVHSSFKSAPKNQTLIEMPERPPPVYLPILIDALQPRTTFREREILMNYIVTTGNWNIENLLELAEQICLEACHPGSDAEEDGHDLLVCPLERYVPINEDESLQCTYPSKYESRSQIVAMVAEELHRQFLEVCGNDIAQGFAWNLREFVLMKFVQYWDGSKDGSISYQPKPTSHCVRSALGLSRSIAGLYTRNLISQAHISMCISVLLADLKSIEHIEALSNIVLGCGQAFWDLNTLLQENSEERVSSDAALTNDDTHWKVFRLSHHVQGNGQMLARLRDIADNVKKWETTLLLRLQEGHSC